MLKFSNDSTARIKSAVEMRYKMLPTLYTLFYSAHTRGTHVELCSVCVCVYTCAVVCLKNLVFHLCI